MAAKKDPLRTKVEPRYVPLLGGEEHREEVFRRWVDEDHEKLMLLADEMRIPNDERRLYALALALARKHCIGFQQRVPRGKWTKLTLGFLVVEIERLTDDKRKIPGHTVTWAAGVLAGRPEWKKFLRGNKNPGEALCDPGEALRVQYQWFYRNRGATVFRGAFNLHELNNTLEEWDARVREALLDPHPTPCPYP